MSDRETMDVYAKAAVDYMKAFPATLDVDQQSDIEAFKAGMPDGARVLDYGCGPGQWAARLREHGFDVDASDASPEMAELAKQKFGITVRVEPFDALEAKGVYDGIWANFSLLHVSREEFPAHLDRVRRALKPKGMFHIGMKLGESEGRDRLGRFYAYYGEDELKGLLEAAGFQVTRSRRGNGKGLAGHKETFVVLTAHA